MWKMEPASIQKNMLNFEQIYHIHVTVSLLLTSNCIHCSCSCNYYYCFIAFFVYCFIIRKYSSISFVGMGEVQNGILYLRYRSDSMIMKAEHCKVFTQEELSLFCCRKCSQASANLSQG